MVMQLIAHGGEPRDARLAVAGDGWAVACRAMVGRHDTGGEMARAIADGFVARLASLPVASELDRHRAGLVEQVQSSVTEAGGGDGDGLVFTVFVTDGDHALRVFNLGPQRTLLVRPGETSTISAPHSLAEQLRKTGSEPSPEHALVSLRVGGVACRPEEVDAQVIEVVDAWVVTLVDDRIAPPRVASTPTSEVLLDLLGERAGEVSNPIEDWLLASSL